LLCLEEWSLVEAEPTDLPYPIGENIAVPTSYIS